MHKPTPITSISMWMQAWNTYLMVLLSHNSAHALKLIGYQRIITSVGPGSDMTGNFVQWLLPTPTFVGISTIKNCGMKTCPTPTLHNDGHALTVGLRTTTQTTALTRPFVTACNVLDHQIAEHPELQHVVTLTMGSAPEMHAPFNTSALHTRAPILASPILTGDQPPKTSEANLRP